MHFILKDATKRFVHNCTEFKLAIETTVTHREYLFRMDFKSSLLHFSVFIYFPDHFIGKIRYTVAKSEFFFIHMHCTHVNNEWDLLTVAINRCISNFEKVNVSTDQNKQDAYETILKSFLCFLVGTQYSKREKTSVSVIYT